MSQVNVLPDGYRFTCSHAAYVNYEYETETEEKVLSVSRSDNFVCDLNESELKVCTS